MNEFNVRAITSGPKFHWFGYYDKLQFDPSCRYVLGMEAGFEHRSPRPDDVIKIGMVDLGDKDRWIELGETRSWCWQQGCMLQWMPGSNSQIVWNDREGDRFVCRILDVFKGKTNTLPHPFYTISPDGRTAVAPDFRRLHDTRPGYGYAGVPDPDSDMPAPENAGIFRLNMETGSHDLIISFADVVKIPNPRNDFSKAKHWFNHLLFNPDGSRFVFLHRWRSPGQAGFGTRMLSCGPGGEDIHVVDDYGKMSHFIWRDNAQILAWSWHPSRQNAFYLYEDLTGRVDVVGEGVMTANGHCSYLAGNEWILNDTYPDADLNQELYLFHPASGKKVSLGKYYSAKIYRQPTTECRCDLHPRSSPDARAVTFDSGHAENGRQIYLVDISSLNLK